MTESRGGDQRRSSADLRYSSELIVITPSLKLGEAPQGKEEDDQGGRLNWRLGRMLPQVMYDSG